MALRLSIIIVSALAVASFAYAGSGKLVQPITLPASADCSGTTHKNHTVRGSEKIIGFQMTQDGACMPVFAQTQKPQEKLVKVPPNPIYQARKGHRQAHIHQHIPAQRQVIYKQAEAHITHLPNEIVKKPTRHVVQHTNTEVTPLYIQPVLKPVIKPIIRMVQPPRLAPSPQHHVIVNVSQAPAYTPRPATVPTLNLNGFGGGVGGGINTAPPGGGNFSTGNRGYGSVLTHPAARLAFRPETPYINITNNPNFENNPRFENNPDTGGGSNCGGSGGSHCGSNSPPCGGGSGRCGGSYPQHPNPYPPCGMHGCGY